MKMIFLVCLLLWLPSVVVTWDNTVDFFYWRHHFVILTGFLALAYMSVAMLTAMRFSKVEQWLDGLDKSYAVHKSLGIHATIALTCHWLLMKIPKWLILLGWLERPHRQNRIHQIQDAIPWATLAKDVGEFAFYAFVIFVGISLFQAISYRHFKFTHKLGGVIFMAGAFHSIVLIDISSETMGMNIVIVSLALLGSVCALISLSGCIGQANKVTGQVSHVQPILDESGHGDIVHFSIQLSKSLSYQAGQFAYLSFDDKEPPHPFSILSYQRHNNHIEFAVKDLGDYTHHLVTSIFVGQKVTVEGGYGKFNIPTSREQVWVGAGIGIVPFLAWLQRLSSTPHNNSQHITLYYCRESDHQQYFVELLNRLVPKLPNVTLQVYTASHNQRLCAQRIANQLDLQQGEVSFCGPKIFGQTLKEQLISMGLDRCHFHNELFNMR